jgi:hypothetical protein
MPGSYHAADLLVPWARSMCPLRGGMDAHLRAHLPGSRVGPAATSSAFFLPAAVALLTERQLSATEAC